MQIENMLHLRLKRLRRNLAHRRKYLGPETSWWSGKETLISLYMWQNYNLANEFTELILNDYNPLIKINSLTTK